MWNTRRIIIYGLFLINLAVVIFIWSGNALSSGLVVGLGRLAGLLAEYFILVQLVLIGRIKFVEQEFGHDKLNRIHRVLGIGIVTTLLTHPLLLAVGYAAQFHTTPWAQFVGFITAND